MDGIKKKLSNLKLQIDEANDRANEYEKDKKELEERVKEVKQCSFNNPQLPYPIYSVD